MSIKVQLFNTLIPQRVNQYFVTIDNSIAVGFLVEAANLPTESLGETTMFNRGQAVYIPTRRSVPGTWECTINEVQLSKIFEFFTNLQLKQRFAHVPLVADKAYMFDMPTVGMFDIKIVSQTLHGVSKHLKGCWLKEVAPVQLSYSDNTNNLKWKLIFRYNYIESANIRTL